MKIFLLMMVWSRQDANLDFLPVRALPTCYQNWSLLKPKLQSNSSICDLKHWLFILPTELSCKVIWNKKIKTLFFLVPLPEIKRQPGSQLIWHSSAHLGHLRVADRISLPLFCTVFQKSLPSQLFWIKWPCSRWRTGTSCRGKRRMKTTLNRRKKLSYLSL